MNIWRKIKCLFGFHKNELITPVEQRFGEQRLFVLVFCPYCFRLLLILSNEHKNKESLTHANHRN